MKVTQFPATGDRHYRTIPRHTAGEERGSGNGIDIRKILSRFEKDDYILAGLLIVLIFEGCDDYILLAALGYLFLMGFKEA